ncbi:hypothetical protein NIES932_14550 [Raphidiopsis curvata NIES-932]|nr:hypothetical protein NIES932_14550 [Raphidiopsis curvata NIES-932]
MQIFGGGLRSTPDGRSHSVFPPVPSQGKNLNVLRGDCITPPTGDCAAHPTGDRSPLGTFHVRFPVGKRLTVNVFRQRINQLFQGGRDIWRGIAKHSRRAIAFSVPPGSFSREKPERVDKRSRSIPYGRSHYILNGRLGSTRYARSLLEIIPLVPSQGKILKVLRGDYITPPTGDCEALATRDRIQELSLRFFSREKLEHAEGRLRSTPRGRSLSSRDVSCSVPVW